SNWCSMTSVISYLISSVDTYMIVFVLHSRYSFSFFFFNDTATTEIYTLSLHDALPISAAPSQRDWRPAFPPACPASSGSSRWERDRKSTRLNSSHLGISYAVFCLKKKKQYQYTDAFT